MQLVELSVGNLIRMRDGEIVKAELHDLSLIETWVSDNYSDMPPRMPVELSEQTLSLTNLKRITDDLWESTHLQVKRYGEVFHLRYKLYTTGSVFMKAVNGIHQLQQAYMLFEGKELEVKLGKERV